MALPNLAIEGIFTHLSSSEIEGDDCNEKQWRLFQALLKKLEESRIYIPVKHLANSGGMLNFGQFHLDMVRPGIMSYGIYPSESLKAKADLLPVMSFKTKVLLVKEFPKGYGIGYNRTYITKKPTRIATIPVGYGDGYGVIMSNQGEALIRGKRVPLVGRVSMDMCTLDVSRIPECEVGDEVVLLGRQGGEYIPANDIAAKAQTISYEVLCALGKRAPRVFIQKGRAGSVEPRLRRDIHSRRGEVDLADRQCHPALLPDACPELRAGRCHLLRDVRGPLRQRGPAARAAHPVPIRYQGVGFHRRRRRQKTPRRGTSSRSRPTSSTRRPCAIPSSSSAARSTTGSSRFSSMSQRCEYRWLLTTSDEAFRESDFRVVRVCVDNEAVPIIRSETTERGYEIWCGGGDSLRKKLNRQVRMKIEIETKKFRSNNLFSVFLVYPTRGLDIDFNYEGMNLKNVREISFFAGKHPYPEVTKEAGKRIRLRISDDEWIFPNSGVTFLWDL